MEFLGEREEWLHLGTKYVNETINQPFIRNSRKRTIPEPVQCPQTKEIEITVRAFIWCGTEQHFHCMHLFSCKLSRSRHTSLSGSSLYWI